MRRLAPVSILLAVVAVITVIAVLAASAGGAQPSFDGTVYIESNGHAKGSNSILAFRYTGGSLRPLDVREYPTGGRGSHDLANFGVLDAEQQIVTNADRTLLFAVNAGSDTVAVFHIADDGTLDPVPGSPFPSRGKAPASVGVSGDTLFVANKAHDGRRSLESEPASYASFHIEGDGSLDAIGVTQVPPRSSPTETYVPPGSDLMVATEESG